MMVETMLLVVLLLVGFPSRAAYLLLPMDEAQRNHLKAYGVAYWTLEREVEVTWLLNYRGGSFMTKYAEMLERECRLRGVTCEVIADGQSSAILSHIADPSVNMGTKLVCRMAKEITYVGTLDLNVLTLRV